MIIKNDNIFQRKQTIQTIQIRPNLLRALLEIKVHCSICELKIVVLEKNRIQHTLISGLSNFGSVYKNALCTITIWREWWSLLPVSVSVSSHYYSTVFQIPSLFIIRRRLVVLFCRLSFLAALDPLMLTAFAGCLHFLESELVCCLTMIRLDYSETKLMCGWLIFASGHMKNT